MSLTLTDVFIARADTTLTETLSEITDIEFLIKAGKMGQHSKSRTFWVKEIEKRKNRLDRKLDFAAQQISQIGNPPKTLSHTFATAKKRKMVVKGRMTKLQNQLIPAKK